MSTIVNPSPGRVLLRLVSEEDQTKSGLYLPNQDERVSVRRGVVVACGNMIDGNGYEQSQVKYSAGQIVLVNRNSGLDMSIDGVQHRMVHYADVIATITKE